MSPSINTLDIDNFLPHTIHMFMNVEPRWLDQYLKDLVKSVFGHFLNILN